MYFECKKLLVDQMNGGSGKNLVLVTVCVPDLRKEDLHFIKYSNTDKEVQVGYYIFALVVLYCVVKLYIEHLW